MSDFFKYAVMLLSVLSWSIGEMEGKELKTAPTKYNVNGILVGACGGQTATITLSGSQTGISYQLYKAVDAVSEPVAEGDPKAGTGSALSWTGLMEGVYTIWTVENETYQGIQMNNSGHTRVTVTALNPTGITTQPENEVNADIDEEFTLGSSMVATGESVTYRWYSCSSTGTDTVFISGATDETYTASQEDEDTYYYCVKVIGKCGEPVLSDVIAVTVFRRYRITYDGNGATGGSVTDESWYEPGELVLVRYNDGTLVRTGGYEFNGWNTKADGTGDEYDYYAYPNDHFTITQDTTLYAQWRIVVNSNTTNLNAFDDPKHKDVRITDGATLTLTQDTTVRNMLVETGSTLHISTDAGDDGITLTAKSLSLQGGWGTVGGETKYDMPRVYIDPKSTLIKTNNIVNFDIAVNNDTYYPFALPFDVPLKISAEQTHYDDPNIVDYAHHTLAYYSNYGASGQFAIKAYNGQSRANNGASSANWEHVSAGTTLKAGRGYALTALALGGIYGDYALIRFPMVADNTWTATGELGRYTDGESVIHIKDTVHVTAYKKAGTGEGTGDATPKANVGWNLLGVPYMSCYTTGSDMYNESNVADPATLIQGRFNYSTNKWEDGDIMYVTVPTHDFSEYVQADITDAGTVLLPGWCFFVQVAETGNLRFLSASEAASSSLPIYAPKRKQEHQPTVRTGIILSGADANDKTTILVSDQYRAAEYEINADLEKMFGENGYTLATYSLSGTTRLAFNAMSYSDATNVIPIGYRAPADGEYTFLINPRYAQNGAFEQVNLIDYETGIVTDLLQYSYTFTTERTQNDSRFALNVVRRQENPTDINNGEGTNGEKANGVRKILLNNKLYIILNGHMYDATGRLKQL